MSKFIKELNKSYRSAMPAIGFRKETDLSKKAPVLLIADLTAKNVKEIKAAISAGVDVAIVRSDGLNKSAAEKVINNIGEVPAGLLLDSEQWENIQEISSLNFDFIICNVKTPVSIIREGDSGKILRVEPWLTPGVVRAINDLNIPFDGIFIDGDNEPITIERLLVCHYMSGMLGKPLLSAVNVPLAQADLQGLYDAGVRAILLPKEISPESVKELKEHIGGLQVSSRKKSHENVVLPGIKREPEIDIDDEDDEDD
jgi:hypothetical protein